MKSQQKKNKCLTNSDINIKFNRGINQKKEADARKNPTSTENKSVLTDRTMDQIKKDSEKNE